MGNYVIYKNDTQKEKNHFIHLMRSHFSLITKNCVAIGTGSLFKLVQNGVHYTPKPCSNLFIMKHLRLASERLASYWNAFLFSTVNRN